MNQTQAQIMDPVTSKIDWTNKLNEYKNVFAFSTEEFKKFAITQNEKVSRKDKEIAQLLKTDANITSELTDKLLNLEAIEQNNSEGLEMKAEECKIDEKDKKYSANDSSIYMHEWIVTSKQEEKLKEYKQGCSRSRDQDLETTRSIIHKKKRKAKQVGASAIQEKENCEILAIMSQILTRLNKLEEWQENKERNGAGSACTYRS
ncbi:15962_t:CDS:2 [Gigaspora margarita]|uniref:15962_t:CDS:1 n=1 Tax=Gigaspora margarita TaxID=4874 RepID=A0ABN7VCZ0_GIGMA|nr:15962_t:CDS:2 [Gigaspora margarita]